MNHPLSEPKLLNFWYRCIFIWWVPSSSRELSWWAHKLIDQNQDQTKLYQSQNWKHQSWETQHGLDCGNNSNKTWSCFWLSILKTKVRSQWSVTQPRVAGKGYRRKISRYQSRDDPTREEIQRERTMFCTICAREPEQGQTHMIQWRGWNVGSNEGRASREAR